MSNRGWRGVVFVLLLAGVALLTGHDPGPFFAACFVILTLDREDG